MDVNCRCALIQRARWALDIDELKTLKERAEYYGLDKSDDFESFKKEYLVINETRKSKKYFHADSNPIREYIGATGKSHPKKVEIIINDMHNSGVNITRRSNCIGYFPNIKVRAYGSVNIEEGASISAWLHEYQHFCNDRNDGYLGFRVFQNLQKCAEREIRAYQVEIDFAKREGYDDVVEKLIELRDAEVKRYE